jgi:hypothetical protein
MSYYTEQIRSILYEIDKLDPDQLRVSNGLYEDLYKTLESTPGKS